MSRRSILADKRSCLNTARDASRRVQDEAEAAAGALPLPCRRPLDQPPALARQGRRTALESARETRRQTYSQEHSPTIFYYFWILIVL